MLRSQKAKATEFRRMHQEGDILVLANAWDVASARIFEEAGFPAIATTSGGIAISLGYPDGQRISRDEMLQVVARIVKSVSVPVTADMEAGYGTGVSEVADTATRLIAAGAIGLNIEDSTKRPESPLFDIDAQSKRISVIKEVGRLLDVPLVINARCDALLVGKDPAASLDEAVERGREYRKAGADCFFPVGAIDSETISRIVKQVGCPVNILVTKGVPPINELRRLGVRRVSVGSGPARATLGLVGKIARELREKGTYMSLLEGAPSHAEANELVAPSQKRN